MQADDTPQGHVIVAAIADANIALAQRKDFSPMPPRRLAPVAKVVAAAAHMLPVMDDTSGGSVREADAVLGAMTSLLIYCAHRGMPYEELLVAAINGLAALQNHINTTGETLKEDNDNDSV